MGIWAELRAWGAAQQTHGKNHASAVGRTAGGDGDACPVQDRRWDAEQETGQMGIRYQEWKSGWREHRKKSGAKGTASVKEMLEKGKDSGTTWIRLWIE